MHGERNLGVAAVKDEAQAAAVLVCGADPAGGKRPRYAELRPSLFSRLERQARIARTDWLPRWWRAPLPQAVGHRDVIRRGNPQNRYQNGCTGIVEVRSGILRRQGVRAIVADLQARFLGDFNVVRRVGRRFHMICRLAVSGGPM